MAYGAAPVFMICFICGFAEISSQSSTQSFSHTYSVSGWTCVYSSASLSSSQTYSVSSETVSPTSSQSSTQSSSHTYSVSGWTCVYPSASLSSSQTYSVLSETVSSTPSEGSTQSSSHTYSASECVCPSASMSSSQTYSVSSETVSSTQNQSSTQSFSHTYSASECVCPSASLSSSQTYSISSETTSPTLDLSLSETLSQTYSVSSETTSPNLGQSSSQAASHTSSQSSSQTTNPAYTMLSETLSLTISQSSSQTSIQTYSVSSQTVSPTRNQTSSVYTTPTPAVNQSTTPRPDANPSCNFCFSSDGVDECNKQQFSSACSSNAFILNFGTSHCFTAAGLFIYNNGNGSQVNVTGIARGCINCTDEELACAEFTAALIAVNVTLLQCNIECCTGNDCNTQNVTFNSTETPDIDECQSNQTNNCEQICVNVPGSFLCDCRDGYKINSDKHSCDDIDECQSDQTNNCEQICVNVPGSFVCDCRDGYKINSDKHSCDEILYANTCYPFGPQQNDHKFGVNDVLYFYYGQCLEIRTNSIGFPFFGRRHYKLYICLNGKLQLNYAWSWWWPQKFGVYRWFKNMAIIAPFWAITDTYAAFGVNHSKVYYHVYDQSGDIMLEKASQDVRLYDKSGAFAKFRATWVLVVTWVKLCPFVYYPYYYYYQSYKNIPLGCEWSNTFQAVIITDGLNSFLMYCYPGGGIKWVVPANEAYWGYWTAWYGLPVAGWNAGDNGQNYINMNGSSNLRGMRGLDKKPGNTGEIGKYFWRIDNNNGKNAFDKCLKWALFQKFANFTTQYNQKVKQDERMACPCNLWQAFFDRRFRWDWLSTWPKLCFKSIRSKSFIIKNGTHFSPINGIVAFKMRQLCCYSTQWPGAWGSLKTGPPDGSRVEVEVPRYELNRVEEILSDEQAYKACCVDTVECIRFYEYRPSDNCSLYDPPIIRWGRGDPHFTTLDGRNYTFNGCGEYVMIDAQNAAFQLQARTGLAQGNSTTATIFTAGAAKEENTSIVEVRVITEGEISILINHTAYSGFNDLTNQSIEIGGNLFISKPEENCLEVSFPSSTSVKFCEKKGMLYFVVTLGDDYKNKTKGLMGTWNDNPDDDYTLPDGTVLPSSLTLREIHFRFGDKWHINQSQSLFAYAQNESVDTFYKPDFVPMFADNITWVNDSVRLAAEAQCGNDYECLFDVASTNDLSVGMVTKDIGIQLVNESNALENFPPKIVDPPDEINAKLNETVQLTITAEDDGMITFQVINKPTGATVNQSGNVLYFTWHVTSSQKVALSFVVTDDKGASTALNPTIKFCACKHGGQCVEPDEGDPVNIDSQFVYMGCACQGGYTGRFCDSDIDACEMNGQPCYDGVGCIDLPPPANASGYTCGPCPTGYTGDGAQCSDIDECQSNQTNSCEQICVNVPGSFFCDCRDGYKINSDKHSCDDLNECEPTNDCMQTCINTPGSYNCSCGQYFKTDPTNWRNCTALNPCDSDFGCVNSICFKGSNNEAKCACFANFEIQNDGKTCKDINECDPAKSLSLCTQICENIPGSYKCSCQKGFQLSKDGYSCEDVNECVDEDLYSCTDEFHKCVNTRGSYKCECEQNLFFIDGKCRGLEKNETAPIPELPTPRTPSEREREQAVKMSLASKNGFKWDFEIYKSFKTETAKAATDFCTENKTKCGLIKDARRARRTLVFDLYTPDQVNLLPGYPNNSTGTYLLVFYVEQPLGLFVGNDSVLPRETLLEIVVTYKSALEKALGTNITAVELFLKPTTPPTTTPPAIEEESSQSWKWIVIGVCVGVVVIIVVIIIFIWWMKKKEKVKPHPEDPLMMGSYSKVSLERANARDSNL